MVEELLSRDGQYHDFPISGRNINHCANEMPCAHCDKQPGLAPRNHYFQPAEVENRVSCNEFCSTLR